MNNEISVHEDNRNKLFMVECASKFMADFINEDNRGPNFTWIRWSDMCVRHVQDQCRLQEYKYDESFIKEYLSVILHRIQR